MKNIILGLTLLSIVSCGVPSYLVLSNWGSAPTKARAYAVGVTILTLGINPLIGYIRVRRSGVELEDSPNYIKDLELVGAKIETQGINGLTEDLMDRFGLSYKSGNRLAQGIFYFHKVSQTRKLTHDELDYLYESSLGVSSKEVNKAILARVNNDDKSFDEFVNKISKEHETSPEHIRTLIEENFSL